MYLLNWNKNVDNIDKVTVINMFNENFKVFSEVKDYLFKQRNSFVIIKEGDSFYISKLGKRISIDVASISEKIKYLFNSLKFEEITISKKEYISFSTGIHNAMDNRIVYSLKKGEKIGIFTETIKKNWYYSFIGYT